MSAQQRGWGPGWPHCQAAGVVKVVCGGNRVRLPVRSEIASLVAQLVHELEAARGRPFRPDWSWGYSCRAIDGTSTPSNHSWGLAVDLDAPENPHIFATEHKKRHALRKEFPGGLVLRSTMPDSAKAIADSLGFQWGGVYPKKPDPMHFEFLGTPDRARKLQQELAGGGGPNTGGPGSTNGDHSRTYTVRAGDTLSEIGKRLGVKWRDIAKMNAVAPPDFMIFPGQILWF